MTTSLPSPRARPTKKMPVYSRSHSSWVGPLPQRMHRCKTVLQIKLTRPSITRSTRVSKDPTGGSLGMRQKVTAVASSNLASGVRAWPMQGILPLSSIPIKHQSTSWTLKFSVSKQHQWGQPSDSDNCSSLKVKISWVSSHLISFRAGSHTCTSHADWIPLPHSYAS